MRVRGTAQQLYDKYTQLARDAASSADRVLSEGYYQHAEHYFRIVSAINAAQGLPPRARAGSRIMVSRAIRTAIKASIRARAKARPRVNTAMSSASPAKTATIASRGNSGIIAKIVITGTIVITARSAASSRATVRISSPATTARKIATKTARTAPSALIARPRRSLIRRSTSAPPWKLNCAPPSRSQPASARSPR
ncbi:DUF4167 domain-containing protein [Acidocella sp. MX-AZ03]|uniref:DUF4167 domain-containing protein n=1 Tax=Acidocella sp. MX-AZ03 TaxID=2697363 RepID=UPI002FD7EE12